MTMTAAELVASKKHILLDFDGPICAAFAGYGATNISRQLAMLIAQEDANVPAELFDSRDPFELLRYAAGLGDAGVLSEVESEFRRLEVIAVRLAPLTPGISEVIQRLSQLGRTISVVSNNSAAAIEVFVRSHRLAALLDGIAARTCADPSLLKPNPHLLLTALSDVGGRPEDAVMIGDSTSDVDAARAAGVSVLAFANRREKAEALRSARPDLVISSIDEMVRTA